VDARISGERQRRAQLARSLQRLRQVVPTVAEESASSARILTEAARYALFLRRKEAQLVQAKQELARQNAAMAATMGSHPAALASHVRSSAAPSASAPAVPGAKRGPMEGGVMEAGAGAPAAKRPALSRASVLHAPLSAASHSSGSLNVAPPSTSQSVMAAATEAYMRHVKQHGTLAGAAPENSLGSLMSAYQQFMRQQQAQQQQQQAQQQQAQQQQAQQQQAQQQQQQYLYYMHQQQQQAQQQAQQQQQHQFLQQQKALELFQRQGGLCQAAGASQLSALQAMISATRDAVSKMSAAPQLPQHQQQQPEQQQPQGRHVESMMRQLQAQSQPSATHHYWQQQQLAAHGGVYPPGSSLSNPVMWPAHA
jgi:hypothetical protein